MLALGTVNNQCSAPATEPVDQSLPSAASKKRLALARYDRVTRPVPVAVIDGSDVFRAGLSHILDGSQFRVTAVYERLEDLPEKTRPWLTLLTADRTIEDLSGAVAHLIRRGTLVVVLTEAAGLEDVLSLIEAGAAGCLLKNEINSSVLLKALELVRLGVNVIPRRFTAGMSSDGGPLEQLEVCDAAAIVARLSSGERSLLELLTEGAANKQIARRLDIAESTVKLRLMLLLRKLGVRNRTQAAMWAAQHLSIL